MKYKTKLVDDKGNFNFKSKNGDLKSYGLLCGYVQTRYDKTQKLSLRLSHNSGNGYDVQAWEQLSNSCKRVFWFSSESLTVARKIFKAKNYQQAFSKLTDKQKYISSMTDYKIDNNPLSPIPA